MALRQPQANHHLPTHFVHFIIPVLGQQLILHDELLPASKNTTEKAQVNGKLHCRTQKQAARVKLESVFFVFVCLHLLAIQLHTHLVVGEPPPPGREVSKRCNSRPVSV